MTSFWVGERVRLRAVEPEDWRAFQEFDAYSADMRAADMLHPPRSEEGYRRWAAEQAVAGSVGDVFRLVIAAVEDDAVVGTVNTADSDPRPGRFSYGIAVGRPYQRRGYAREAIVILLRYMFGERRYHKCEVGIYGFNQASVALHRRLGFVEEGRLRDHEYFGGRHHDLVLMGVTAPEFAGAHPLPAAHDPS